MPLLRPVADGSDPWLAWRLAWAYNILERPDSAAFFAGLAWSRMPQVELFLAEYMKALRRLDRPGEVDSLARFVRGGGQARYQAAAAGHAPSLEWLEEASMSDDDSTAADACAWLAVLGRAAGGDGLEEARRAVELRPGESFYRSVLIGLLCDRGLLEEAAGHLRAMRLDGCRDRGFWTAQADVARLEGDHERVIWACRRAYDCRTAPEEARSLGWALVSAARDDLRSGRPESAARRLAEAAGLGWPGEEFESVADSMLSVMEGENR